ncbi:MAG: phosphatase PAP2 family protein [Paludibacteraceae bacterium]|nr:phosphatase PAP2 family protein [Paludibacteraceae bacterium]MBP9017809.1 phosphatase PAP2 family protein [Paludibacteraceae bacterium]
MKKISTPKFRFFLVEKLTLVYIFVSSVIILSLSRFNSIYPLMMHRFIIMSVILFLVYLNSILNWKSIKILRNLFIGILIVFWYPETFDINRFISNHDYLLANWDQMLFGFQPAFLFCQLFTWHWFSELMYIGYFFYYLLIVGSIAYIYFSHREYFEYFFFTILFSFFVYYLVFIIFPTAGPQYYYSAIGIQNIKSGVFPEIGNYFNHNPALIPFHTEHGFFVDLVESVQKFGERPTAAFPSSHVGISTLILLLLIRGRHYSAFTITFPLYLILVFATIYIQAHYVVDVIGGILSAFILYLISPATFKLFMLNHPKKEEKVFINENDKR